IELERQRRPLEALRYFRRAAESGSGWIPHFNYAGALSNAANAVRSVAGLPATETRSAIERVALVRAALGEFSVAADRAGEPRVRAALIMARAQLLEKWGFPLDALEGYHASLAIDPTSAATRKAEAGCRESLRGSAPAMPGS